MACRLSISTGMREFTGTIRLEDGEGEGLATRFVVESGRLVATSGEHEIGDWAVEELSVERRNGDFHIGVEGEQLVVGVADPVGFSDVLGVEEPKPKPEKVRKARSLRRKPPKPEPVAQAAAPPVEVPSRPPESVSVPAPEPSESSGAAKEKETGPSLWAQIPNKWKLAGFGAICLVILGVLVPNILALLLILAGMATLFLAIAAKSESGSVVSPPPFFATATAGFLGIGLVLLAAVIMVIT